MNLIGWIDGFIKEWILVRCHLYTVDHFVERCDCFIINGIIEGNNHQKWKTVHEESFDKEDVEELI